MKLTLLTSTVAAVAVFTLSSPASAQGPGQTTTRTADYTERKEVGGDQVVNFTGDELAGLTGNADGLIKVRTGPARVPLIRPRLNFVPELLKTVENL